jgi:UDP-glucose 4-epimerase
MVAKLLDGKSLLVTGGTGSLGHAIIERIRGGKYGLPRKVVVFSRDELKQAEMATKYKDLIYMRFIIGDVRQYGSVLAAIWGIDYIVHAAAMKRVETCQRFMDEALYTNCIGTMNLVKAVKESRTDTECLVGVSSDKGVKPINCYGWTKIWQEMRLQQAVSEYDGCRFVCVRYGNVVGSRGSVIPIWQGQIKRGAPILVTDPKMTRFLVTLERAVDTLFAAIQDAKSGDIYIPYPLPAARIGELAELMVDGSQSSISVIGKGYGEKVHETLITEDELDRTKLTDGYYVVTRQKQLKLIIAKEYISNNYLFTKDQLRDFLHQEGIV